MPLTVSTPYKSGVLESISGIAGDVFNSTGTPFVATDVGRCIVMTNGAAVGCIRKITEYIDNNSVRLDYVFGLSPFAALLNEATGLPFSEAAPSPGDAWQMSYLLDDLDDGVNIIKHSDHAYSFGAGRAITLNGVFLYDTAKSLEINSQIVRTNASSYWRLGDITRDGKGKNACLLVDVASGSSGFSSSGAGGDFHMYGGVIRSPSTASPSHFWRLYRGNDHIVRMVDVRVSGVFGCRLQGAQSVMLRVNFDECSGGFGPFNTIPQFGGVIDCSVADSPRAVFWNPDNGPHFVARALAFARVNNLFVAGGSSDLGSVTFRDLDLHAAAALPVLYNNSGNKPNSPLVFTQRLGVSAVNAALEPVTDALRLHVTNAQGDEVINATSTTGSFAPVDLVARDSVIGSAGNHVFAEGTDRTPFLARLIGYEWQEASISLTMARPGDWSATLLPDARVAAPNVAAALAVVGISVTQNAITLTSDVTVQQVFDYVKATSFANPGWPNLLPGGIGDFGVLDIVVDGATLTGELVTAGNVTALNGGVVVGVYEDATGRRVTFSAPALIAGSLVQVYDLTAGAQLFLGTLPSDGLSLPVTWTADHTLRIRAEHETKLALETVAVLTSSGATVLDSQAEDERYNEKGIDGTAVTELSADLPNIQIDINDPDGMLDIWRLYAWAQAYQNTPEGIASDFFGAITSPDDATVVIDQAKADIKLDNVSSLPVRVVGGYLARKDGSTVIAATSGSIQMDPKKAYVATLGGGLATAAQVAALGAPLQAADYTAPVSAAELQGAVRAELAPELARLDVAVSTRLASADYTEPPAAAPTLAQIGQAVAFEINSADLATAVALAELPAPLDAAATRVAVRAELAPELARLDVAVSTRLASADYTEPPAAAPTLAQIGQAVAAEIDAAALATAADLAELPVPLSALETQAAAAAAVAGADLATAAQVTALGTPLQAEDYTAPPAAGLTPEQAAQLDAVQTATALIPALL